MVKNLQTSVNHKVSWKRITTRFHETITLQTVISSYCDSYAAAVRAGSLPSPCAQLPSLRQ